MTAMNHEQEGLDAYLRREYAYLGSEGVEELLRRTPQEKQYLKSLIEREKLQDCLLRRARLFGSLGPPFLPKALTPGPKRPEEEAQRPFVGRYSSHEAGIRASLLPDNLYFAQDAVVVREVLGLPTDGVQGVLMEAIPKAYWWWKEQAPLDVPLLANLWEEIHEARAEKKPYTGPDLPQFVPSFLRDYLASDNLIPHADQAAAWLDGEQEFRWGQPPGYKGTLPLHRFAAKLLDRYGLPPQLFDPVCRYLFSHQVEDLKPVLKSHPLHDTGLSPRLEFVRPPGGGYYSIALTVQGIDTFTTYQEWKAVWELL